MGTPCKKKESLLQKYWPTLSLLFFSIAYCLKFYHSDFILQFDVFLNLYNQHHASLFRSGWDPYTVGYAGWYPVAGTLVPTLALLHFILDFFPDHTPLVTLVGLMVHFTVLLCFLSLSAYVLFRHYKLSRPAAVLASVIVSYSCFHAYSCVRELNTFFMLSLLGCPWTLLFMDKAYQEKSVRYALLAGVAIGTSLWGGSNSPLFFLIPLLPFLALEQASEPFSRRLARISLYLTVALTIGFLVGAHNILPNLIYGKLTQRSFVLSQEQLLQPRFLEFFETLLSPIQENGEIDPNTNLFLGLAVLFLAIRGYASTQSKRRFFSALIIGCVLFLVVGSLPSLLQTPLLFYAKTVSFRMRNYRAGMVLLFPIAYFAAKGFESIKGTIKSYWLALPLVYFFYLWQKSHHSFPKEIQISAFIISILTILFFLILALRPTKKYWTIPVLYLIFWVASVDLPLYGRAKTGSLQEQVESFYTKPKKTYQRLVGNAPEDPIRIFNFKPRMNLWAPELGIDVAFDPFDDPASPIYLTWLGKAAILGKNPNVHSPFLDLYGIKYIENKTLLDIGLSGIQGLKPTSENGVFENPHPFPRAFLTHGIKPLALTTESLRAIVTASRQELQSQTYVLGNNKIVQSWNDSILNSHPYPSDDSVKIKSRDPRRILVETRSAEAAVLNLSEIWFPAWKVKVDGKAAQLFTGYGSFWAVLLPSGAHQVEFYWEDSVLLFSRWLSVLSLIITILLYSTWKNRLPIPRKVFSKSLRNSANNTGTILPGFQGESP